MHFEPTSWGLIALSVAAAIAYGFVYEQKPASFVRAVVKTIFLAALAAAFAIAHAPPLFVIALAAAALGDLFLAFDKPIVLPLGMIAFLVMQVLYILTYLDYVPDEVSPTWPRYAIAAAIGLVVLVYLIWFWREPRPGRNPLLALLAIAGAFAIGGAPIVLALTGRLTFSNGSINLEPNLYVTGAVLLASIVFMVLRRDLGAVKLAGMIYAAVILQMVYTSLWLPWSGWPIMLGAFSFLVSDGVLSAELFRMAPDAPAKRITGPIIWWSYAAAQLLIAAGVVALA
ncbi:MAG TPA: lysoplasmalogenase family protein [Caulobacterales bacterium]|nr:lysoplasmalogenase family protein [Caulobacterales bacterium]